ncbi:MAG: D-arabinose 5-phosphate isomerase, partial [Legionella sp. 21-45-4]
QPCPAPPLETEAQAIFNLAQRIDERFSRACELLLACEGRIVLTGMGKSGHISKKIAATFASTGSPAFFMHPGEASHGDFGMVTPKDVVVAISYSGNTHELLTLLPVLKRLNVPLISLTGHSNSFLANAATVNLDVSIHQEACPLGLAPTTSTTAALVMGDALAIALLDARGFTAEDFARSHPGGSLGKKLLLKVDALSHKKSNIPICLDTDLVRDALIEVNEKKLGMTCVVNKHEVLVGVFTDGDIRRTLTQSLDIHSTCLSQVMSTQFQRIDSDALAVEALTKMQTHAITALVITDEHQRPAGVLHIHDLLRAGII